MNNERDVVQLIQRLLNNLGREARVYEDVEPIDREHDQIVLEMRRLVESAAAAPQSPSVGAELGIECWQCNRQVGLVERAENDGECPSCAAELDASTYLEEFVSKHKSAYDIITARDQQIAALSAQLAACQARVAELEADAVRYRWLREASHFDTHQHQVFCKTYAEGLDAEIDAALAQQVTKDE